VVRIGWYKDNRVYIRTAMPFGTRLNLKPFEVFEVHFPTKMDVTIGHGEDAGSSPAE
jgi:hypothetical protein